MVIGQGLLVISTPFLTRLYTPEDFGLFAVFTALSSILITIVSLRYEYAIPVESDERAAIALVAAVGLVSFGLSLLVLLGLHLWSAPLGTIFGMPELTSFLWLLPLCMIMWGLGSALSFWSVRQGTFRLIGANRIVHYGTQAVGQLALAPSGFGGGLIFGYILGYLARLVHLAPLVGRSIGPTLLRVSFREIREVMSRHWRYPVFSASSSMLQAGGNMLPAIFIAILYGPTMAGLYALAQRVIGLPLRLISESASQVFLGEARNVDRVALFRLFKRMVLLFVVLGLIGMVPLIWVGPWLFSIVFGEAWREAGILVRLLAPLYLVRFVVIPVAQTLNVLNQQNLHLVASLINSLALLVSFTVGWWLSLEVHATVSLFSVSSSLAFIFYIAAAWRALRRASDEEQRRFS